MRMVVVRRSGGGGGGGVLRKEGHVARVRSSDGRVQFQEEIGKELSLWSKHALSTSLQNASLESQKEREGNSSCEMNGSVLPSCTLKYQVKKEGK